MKRLTEFFVGLMVWHLGTAWLATRMGLGGEAFLGVVALSAAIADWAHRRWVSNAEIETEVWSLLGTSVTRETVVSLVALAISSLGFSAIVLPHYGWELYVMSVGVTYGVTIGSAWWHA